MKKLLAVLAVYGLFFYMVGEANANPPKQTSLPSISISITNLSLSMIFSNNPSLWLVQARFFDKNQNPTNFITYRVVSVQVVCNSTFVVSYPNVPGYPVIIEHDEKVKLDRVLMMVKLPPKEGPFRDLPPTIESLEIYVDFSDPNISNVKSVGVGKLYIGGLFADTTKFMFVPAPGDVVKSRRAPQKP